ncbi:hypothetical protein TEA_013309 [Camellia sinensis var. sinensis]|uniref:RING-type domain-containing protein n=1 Tax=Camellia sinensis var. sinensis TaxID=542762 RepID=A0A4S4DRB0_CAMSN|nr:hypothetical protein TEA_013309 [Camellia sinensis var. sinensis]
MKWKLVLNFNYEASNIIPIIACLVVPVVSLLHTYAKSFSISLWSLALCTFHHDHNHDHDHDQRDEIDTTNVGEEREEDGPELECVVCLNRVSSGEKYRLLGCNHGFHVHCIEAWLQASSTCPLCRNPAMPLSPHHRRHPCQQQHFYDDLVSCFFSTLENICKWMESPLDSELMLALCENSKYLS